MSLHRIGRRLQRRKVLLLTVSRLERQAFFLLILLSVPLAFRFRPHILAPATITILVIVLAGAISAYVRSALERRSVNPLCDADRLIQANSLLTTAWDVRTPDDSRYPEETRHMVLKRAAPLLKRISPEWVYPYRPSRYLHLIPVALLFLGGVWLATTGLDANRPAWAGYGEAERTPRRNPTQEDSPEEDRSGAALADELARLSEALETRPSEKDLLRDPEFISPDDAGRNRRLGATDLLNENEGSPLTDGSDAPAAALRATRDDRAEPVPGTASGEIPPNPQPSEGESGTTSSDDDGEELGDTSRGDSSGDTNTERDGSEERETDEAGAGGSSGEGESREPEPTENDESGSGTPGTEAYTDVPNPENSRPSTMTDAIRHVLELPRVGAEGDVTELLALETPGVSDATTGPFNPDNPEFERQLQMTFTRHSVPLEVQEYVRNYFIIIARRQEEER